MKSHDRDPEEYMTTSTQVDAERSMSLAEEHNKQLIAGEMPVIVPELITPEHIQIHATLIDSPNIDRETKQLVMKHVLEEMRISKIGGAGGEMPGGAVPGMRMPSMKEEFPAVERTPELAKPLSKSSGLPSSVVRPPTAIEVGFPAPNRPVIKPR